MAADTFWIGDGDRASVINERLGVSLLLVDDEAMMWSLFERGLSLERVCELFAAVGSIDAVHSGQLIEEFLCKLGDFGLLEAGCDVEHPGDE